MNLRNKVLTFSTGLLLVSNIALGSVTPLQDISYNFDQTKVNASADTFHFLRSFVDYFYDLIAKNPNSLHIAKKAGSIGGWCVGDAHAENFGILLEDNGQAVFTMNDMDDSGPCPVAYDLFRLLVSSRLYMPNINTQKIINSYLDGLNGKSASFPDSIKSMTKDALNSGFIIESKDLNGWAFKRKNSMSEVDSTLKVQISTLIESQYTNENLKVLDIVGKAKVGGGSGGLQRYEVLITNSKNQFIHLELKELVTPSIAAVATSAIPDQASRMKRTLQIDQGNGFSHYYNVLNIQGKTMLLRPKFSGNIGVDLASNGDKDNKEIINFEAYILGRIHANTINVSSYIGALNNMSADKWEEDIQSMTEVFNKRFNDLKK